MNPNKLLMLVTHRVKYFWRETEDSNFTRLLSFVLYFYAQRLQGSKFPQLWTATGEMNELEQRKLKKKSEIEVKMDYKCICKDFCTFVLKVKIF